jgi:hypothetical protein
MDLTEWADPEEILNEDRKRKAEEPAEGEPDAKNPFEDASEGRVTIVEASILDSKEQYIAHPCNSITSDARGLTLEIFEKFPFANNWAKRSKTNASRRGSIDVHKSDKGPSIINMYSQHFPGPGKFDDHTENRKKWFQNCLDKISEIADLKSIAFPFLMNTGTGTWKDYKDMLDEFARENPKVSVFLYKSMEEKRQNTTPTSRGRF